MGFEGCYHNTIGRGEFRVLTVNKKKKTILLYLKVLE
jgi:hypothetical protein